jgi:serine/threonine-protein kinase
VAQQKPEPVAPPAAQVAVPDPSLTNDSIIEMVTQKVPVPVILDQIRSTKSKFDLSTAEIIRLSKAGVPVNVIQAMRDPSKAPVTAAAKPAAGLPAGLKSAQTNPLPASSSPKDPPVPSTASVPIPAPHQPAPVVAPPPVPTVPSPPAVTVNLVDGLPFGIELAEDVSNEVKAGTTIRFRVPKEVVSEGSVVIPKGTIVTGQVVEESRKKAFVVNVKATYELLKADLAGGQTLRVRATPTAGQSRRPIDSAAKKKPKDVAAPAGTPFVAYVDGAQKATVRK